MKKMTHMNFLLTLLLKLYAQRPLQEHNTGYIDYR